MVEQLGLATIPFGMFRRASALTSGTTSGTSGSMRQALELSTTKAPAFAAIGLYSRLIIAGVLDRTTSTPANASGRSASTGYVLPRNSIGLPALRSEARNLMARRGNLCSTSTCRMISPTAPVAPTTATLGTTNGFLSLRTARGERPAHPETINSPLSTPFGGTTRGKRLKHSRAPGNPYKADTCATSNSLPRLTAPGYSPRRQEVASHDPERSSGSDPRKRGARRRSALHGLPRPVAALHHPGRRS